MLHPAFCPCCEAHPAEDLRLLRRHAALGLGALLGAGAAREVAAQAGPPDRRFRAIAAPIDRAAEPVVPPPNPLQRRMDEIRSGIWRVQEGGIFSTTLITDGGAIVLDPVNADAASWLAAQIRARFGVPVRFVIYSHNHDDHIRGAEAFADDRPQIVAHRLAALAIERTGSPVPLPTLVFDEMLRLSLAGRVVDLRYHGPNDGMGSISVHYPDARVLTVIDWIVARRLPFRTYARYDIDGSIASIAEVERLDFDLVAPGHHVIGDRDDVVILRRYLEALRAGVLTGMRERRSLLEIIPTLSAELATVSAFRDLAFFNEWVALNIAGAWDQMVRVSGWMTEENAWSPVAPAGRVGSTQ